METLVHRVRDLHKLGDRFLGNGDVDGCQCFLLVEPPDVEFVDGQNTWDLKFMANISLALQRSSDNILFRDHV